MEASDNKTAISTLNSLIETLVDGEKGYQQAAQEIKDADLKNLFGEYAMQRTKFASELKKEVAQLGDQTPEQSGSATAAVHRGWINLKAAITSQDRHAILAECERGEDVAVSAYRKALATEAGLSGSAKASVQQQSDAILAAHNDVKKLRDTSAAS